MSEEKNIWVDDKLKREDEALGILKYIIGHRKQSPENSLVMNINADWGFAKSYMLNKMKEELASKKVPTVFFNVWNNDFEKDPLLAFLLELNESLSAFKDEAKVDEAKLKSLGIGLLKVAGKAASKKYWVWVLMNLLKPLVTVKIMERGNQTLKNQLVQT